jgi:hypothetical protein
MKVFRSLEWIGPSPLVQREQMRTLLSPSLQAGFGRLFAQREVFFPMIEGAGMTTLWRRPTEADWAVGDTLLHLCKTMGVYRLW